MFWPGVGEGITMESDTGRFTRVLLLWLELYSALARARIRDGDRPKPEPVPWESQDLQVSKIWRQLTDPANLLALEQWLCQSAEGQSAEWAREALSLCRERARRDAHSAD